jgi:TolB-like protein
MSEPNKAVFLSYASQDAEVAQRICEALRAAGIEVWFDKSELRGGDVWDQKIRRQIRECALFIPVVSAHTQARLEGYFRREWRLAIERTQDMADERPFLVPLVIDNTDCSAATVPELFRKVQWTQLTAEQPLSEFTTRITGLLAPAVVTANNGSGGRSEQNPPANAAPASPGRRGTSSAPRFQLRSMAPWLVATAVIIAATAYVGMDRLRLGSAPLAVPKAASQGSTKDSAAEFSPPPHSLAVLPFENLSGDVRQEYFADGLSEELLNSLAGVPGLQVAARTSSFSFKGRNEDIGTIARKLNVGAILEGSVRRDGLRLRITAQLISATTGYHLWSQAYDRTLHDALTLQTEIAQAVTAALQATMLASTESRPVVEQGGTNNPQAFDAYLRGQGIEPITAVAASAKIQAYEDATRLDPEYAKAYAALATATSTYAGAYALVDKSRALQEKARRYAERAVALAPALADAHLALGEVLDSGLLEFSAAAIEFDRAKVLAPGDARVLSVTAFSLVRRGQIQEAIARARRAVILDPLSSNAHEGLGEVLLFSHREREAIAEFDRALSLNAKQAFALGLKGFALAWLGDAEAALKVCETPPPSFVTQTCRAIVQEQLNHPADAKKVIESLQKDNGDSMSYQYAEIYAQWADREKALGWLEKAYRYRDPGLSWMPMDRFIDPLRGDARYRDIERRLNYPK